MSESNAVPPLLFIIVPPHGLSRTEKRSSDRREYISRRFNRRDKLIATYTCAGYEARKSNMSHLCVGLLYRRHGS